MPSAAADATTPDPHTAAVQPALASSLYQLTVPKPASAVAAPDAISKAGVKAENKPQAEVDAKAQSESRAGQSAAVSDVPAARTGPGLGQTVWDQVKRHSNSADHAASTPARISGEGSHQATFSQAAASHQAVREQSSQNRTSGVQRKLGELDPATAAAAAKPSLPTAAVTEDGHSMLEGGSDSSTDKPNALSASQTAAVAGKALGAVEKADDSDNNNIESTTLTVKQMPSSQQSAAAANAFGLPDMTQAIFIPMASPHPLHAAHTGAMPYPPTSPGRSTAPATVSAVRGTASGVATRTGGPQTDHAAHAPHAFGQPDSTSSPRRASASAAMGASAGSRGQSAGLVGSPGGGVKPVGFFAGQMAAQQWAIPANHASANQASANHTLANHTPASHASAQPAATGRSSGGGSSPRKSLESLKVGQTVACLHVIP